MSVVPKHVVIVTSEFPPQPGGIGTHAYHLAKYLAKNHFKVTVIADQRDVINEDETSFDKASPFLVHRIALRKMRVIMYFNRIIKTFHTIKHADLIIATGKFSLWNVALNTIFLKRPTMAVIHGSEVNFKFRVLKKSIDMALSKMDCIVAVSLYTKQLVAHLNKKIYVIPNGIEMAHWQLERNTASALNGNPILTTVGRISTRKGQIQVIKMLPYLLMEYPRLHYHCVGIPTDADKLMAVAHNLGVEQHVTLHGVLSDSDLKNLLLSTNVFVMHSQESSSGDVEGFGIAILEANALGIPAIGTLGCGIEDAIKDGITGFLIQGNDALSFKKSLDSLFQNKQLFKNQSIQWAKEHDWNLLIKRYIDLMP